MTHETEERLIVAAIAIAVAVVLGWLVLAEIRDGQACEARGGVMARTFNGYECVAPLKEIR